MEIISRLMNSIIFWSAWMIIPFMMEIIPSIGTIIVLLKRKKRPKQDGKPIIYPEISIIIPVYNSAGSLEACIKSIYDSEYPNDRIRVFLVNNKSRDNSFQVFSECQERYPELIMQWLNSQQGKSRALNLALYNSSGKYIIHIDSDGLLEKSALRHMVERFEADLSVNCMTGAICTNPAMIEEYPHGFSRLFRKLEFMEYAQAFLAGRNYASEKNAIYTLSGAFSGFRKSAILKSWLYSTDTICEDTHITFQMKYLQKEKIKICEKAIFFVDPIEDMDKLYTQRQRWQRGSLEVSKMFMRFGLNPFKLVSDVTVRTLMYDHTFAFPRLVWYVALICLLFLGYSGKIIGISMFGIFAMYIIIGYFYFFSILGFLSEFENLCQYYRKQWWVIAFLPFFNLFVFFIRMAGIINSIDADSAWKTRTLTEERASAKAQVQKDFRHVISAVKKLRGLVNNPPEYVPDTAKKTFLWYAVFAVGYLIADLLFVIIVWVNATFGVGLDEIISTILAPLKGTSNDVVISAVKYCLPRVLLLLLPFAGLLWLTAARQKRFLSERRDKTEKRPGLLCLLQRMVPVICMCSLLACACYANRCFDVIGYFKKSIGKTLLYEQYYIPPEDLMITAEGKKKNLLYIYLESMETTYASYQEGGHQNVNYMPNLTALAKEHLSFSHQEGLGGFHSGTGSGWTMAALFSTTAGVPYNFQSDGVDFAPGITTLGDILAKQGYRQEFLCGSDAAFGARKTYFEQHGNYEIFDLFTAREKGYIPEDYFVWWGFEDRILFQIAKDELLRLAEGEEPFQLTMLTVDAHHIDGYVCAECGSKYENQTANVIACTDRLLGEFISWVQAQAFYDDTVIVITGDHPRMDTSLVEGVSYYDRTIYNCFINTEKELPAERLKNREFTAQDIFPTVLAAMGFQIPGDRLGLGTNLFSGEKTLTELYGFTWYQTETAKESDFYSQNFLLEQKENREDR